MKDISYPPMEAEDEKLFKPAEHNFRGYSLSCKMALLRHLDWLLGMQTNYKDARIETKAARG